VIRQAARAATFSSVLFGMLMMALAVAAELPREQDDPRSAAGVVGIGGHAEGNAPVAAGRERSDALKPAEELRGMALRQGLEHRIQAHFQQQDRSDRSAFVLLAVSGIAYSREQVRMHGYGLYQRENESPAAGDEVQFIARFDKRSGRLESLSYEASALRASDVGLALGSEELQGNEDFTGGDALARF
jgi:hypothetical protein